MPVVVFLVVLFVSGFIFSNTRHLDRFIHHQRNGDVETLIDTIKRDYADHFTEDDTIFGSGKTLQQYCREHNLRCRDYKGAWKWSIEKKSSPSGLFTYYVITVEDAAGRVLGKVSGLPYWANYLRLVELNQNVICKALIDYYRDMVRVYSYPLNWYAKNGIACHYDNGVDALDFGGAKIEKEINCSEGWKDGEKVSGNLEIITGGKWNWPTGHLQYDNGNEIYSFGYPCYGATTVDGQPLTGNQPPYAVAFRLWIKTGYYTVCCGY